MESLPPTFYQEMKQEKREFQDNCLHTTPGIAFDDGVARTRLCGQWIQGQLVLVCPGCRKEFHLPAKDEQTEPEEFLIPRAHLVGGSTWEEQRQPKPPKQCSICGAAKRFVCIECELISRLPEAPTL